MATTRTQSQRQAATPLSLGRRSGNKWHRVGGLLVTVACLVVAAIVFRPAFAAASPHDRVTTSTLAGDHAEQVGAVIDLIEGCHAVLAVHSGQGHPLSEIAIWIADTDQSGHPDVDEVAVISHGSLASAIRLYRCPVGSPGQPSPLAIEIPTTGSTDGRFFKAWRRAGEVTSHVLASGLSDVEFRWLNEIDRLGRRPLQLGLRWTSDSADAPELDRVVINAQMGVEQKTTQQ